jgi:competence ComEA-like helix-hairpin-helix protein
MFYSRPQLKLLLTLAATLLIGFGVREWRAGFPDLADRLERFDREEPAAPVPPPSRPDRKSVRGVKPAVAAPADTAPGETNASSTAATSAAGAEASATSPVAVAAAAEAPPLDINRASAAEFARLPGVGPALAERIVAERERRGRFESPEALRYVLGMGPKKLAAIRERITIGE